MQFAARGTPLMNISQIDGYIENGRVILPWPVALPDGTRVQVSIECGQESKADSAILSTVYLESAASWSDFVEQTYGSCAGLGLERIEEGEFESRETIR